MKKLVECVPNFSEGQNKETIQAITDAIANTEGCKVLDVDPGQSTNRTVYTFVGDEKAIIEGALAAARVAKELINMSKHTGEHPRFGAMDVCPFIPVANVTMDECVEISKEFASRAAEELKVPFYLYEHSATKENRRKLPSVRKGQYEGLEERLNDPEWAPDYGPTEFVPGWGATATGARMFLIAYNVNVLGAASKAHDIALELRETGRGKDKPPGRLKEVKGIGWFVDEYNMAQVSVNLNNYKVTPIHVLFEEVKKEAERLKVGIAGSEIVGIVPLESILMAADYYIEKEGLFIIDEEQKVRLAIERMGLNSVANFNPKERIIEYIVAEERNEPLASLSLRGFIEDVAAGSPAPGGGSVAAALAALGAGLGSMVGKLTYNGMKYQHLEADLRPVIEPLHNLTQELIPMVDADTNAFGDFMKALKMPKATDEQKAIRSQKMQDGLKKAVDVPLGTMATADKAWESLCEIAKIGMIASKSDVQVGAMSLRTGIWGAYQNVQINLADIKDEEYKKQVLAQTEIIMDRSENKCNEVLEILAGR